LKNVNKVLNKENFQMLYYEHSYMYNKTCLTILNIQFNNLNTYEIWMFHC
jgi:hypothetical protein